MEKEVVLLKVQEIFREIIDDDELELSEEMTANDIDGYDSLVHIQIVAAIEKEYNFKFKSSEIHSWNSIGMMLECIMNKL